MLKFIRQSRLSLVLLAVVGLLIFLHFIGILGPVEGLAVKIFSPVQRSFYLAGVRFNNIYSILTDRPTTQSQAEDLRQEVNRLTVENSNLKIQLEASQKLLTQQEFLESLEYESIPAHVIGINPEVNLNSIILDKGSQHGVESGLPVIIDDGVMVGKITEVKLSSSEVILINDSRSRIAAEVQNENGSHGVVVGQRGLSLTMELIPQHELLLPGDVVITSGIEPNIVRGLILGTLSRITSEPNSLFQTARLQTLTKLDDLTVVSILKSQVHD